MITVNAMGYNCPIPVVKTLNAMKTLQGPDVIETLVDNEIAVQNLTRMASQKGCTVKSEKLGEKEYRILEYLIANGGQILTREQLALKIWGFESEAEYNNVEVYMSFTRKKLAFVGAKTEIKAVRGIGYELRCGDV